MADGRVKIIEEVEVGEYLASGRVDGIYQNRSQNLYELDGVQVTGGHPVFAYGKWMHARKCPDAKRLPLEKDIQVHNLITSTGIISLVTETGFLIFGDGKTHRDADEEAFMDEYVQFVCASTQRCDAFPAGERLGVGRRGERC